jgi:hypothetical protein
MLARMWWGVVYGEGTHTLLVGIYISAAAKEISVEGPQMKIKLPYDPAVPLLGIYLKECKSADNRDSCTLMFIAALFTVAKLWNQPRCPTTDEWIKKKI